MQLSDCFLEGVPESTYNLLVFGNELIFRITEFAQPHLSELNGFL